MMIDRTNDFNTNKYCHQTKKIGDMIMNFTSSEEKLKSKDFWGWSNLNVVYVSKDTTVQNNLNRFFNHISSEFLAAAGRVFHSQPFRIFCVLTSAKRNTKSLHSCSICTFYFPFYCTIITFASYIQLLSSKNSKCFAASSLCRSVSPLSRLVFYNAVTYFIRWPAFNICSGHHPLHITSKSQISLRRRFNLDSIFLRSLYSLYTVGLYQLTTFVQLINAGGTITRVFYL